MLTLLCCTSIACPARANSHRKHRHTSSQQQTAAPVTVPGMRKYLDQRFGFSFWYPEAWTVRREESVADPTNAGWYHGGLVVHRLTVTSPRDTGNFHGIAIDELIVRTGVLTEHSHATGGSNAVGTDIHFSVDPKATTATGSGNATFSSLPIVYGASRQQAEVIIALDRNHFLVLTTGNPGGNMDHLHLAETITSRRPDGVWPNNSQAETEAIRTAAAGLGIVIPPASAP